MAIVAKSFCIKCILAGVALALSVSAASVSAAAFADEPRTSEDSAARNILEKADRIRFPRESFQVDVEIDTNSSDQGVEKRKYRVLSKGNDNTVIMILEPASERGQIMLMKGRDLWIFMPEVSQPIRLGLSQRLTGQVANGDLARINFSADYTPTILRAETIDGRPANVLELMANDRTVTYHRVLLWVDKTTDRPLKAQFFSLSNRLMKTCAYEDYQYVAGTQRPMRLVMEDALVPGNRSVLVYRGLKLRNLPDQVFSKDYLKKLQ